ncbi:hypothetical protein AJ79_03868 [Helicocarpus griseus UAMH5409]|uniref:Uncharacterized protein n=1 Tax=Helicocarpus griseus UAMH5409 TaxID=1447875 RepID=A0A2B7XVX6_9EURO|nr:hypothetical protein AJ79_03868 [Helicocarpus griseus UAMH5409]
MKLSLFGLLALSFGAIAASPFEARQIQARSQNGVAARDSSLDALIAEIKKEGVFDPEDALRMVKNHPKLMQMVQQGEGAAIAARADRGLDPSLWVDVPQSCASCMTQCLTGLLGYKYEEFAPVKSGVVWTQMER